MVNRGWGSYFLSAFIAVSLTSMSMAEEGVHKLDTSYREATHPVTEADNVCIDLMRARYLGDKEANSIPSGPFRSSLLKEKAEKKYLASEKNKVVSMFNGPWELGIVPTLQAQQDALSQTAQIFLDPDLWTLDQVETYLSHPRPKTFNFLGDSSNQEMKINLDELERSQGEAGYLEQTKNSALIAAACTQMTTKDTFKCQTAVRTLLGEVRYNGNYILPHVWKHVLTNPKLAEGLRLAALTMLKKARTQNAGTANLFEDLSSSFKMAGLEEADAIEAAWKVLALYSNGGQNTGMRALMLDLPASAGQAVVSLAMISSSITAIEFVRAEQGLPSYSIPKSVGNCFSTKPYHFWLSAFLSRRLVQMGIDPRNAARAAFIAAKGYQVNRDMAGAGKGVDSIVLRSPSDSVSNVVRMDISLAGAGSVYGASAIHGEQKYLNLQSALVTSIESGAKVPALEAEKAKEIAGSKVRALMRWDEIFRPNAVFDLFFGKQFNN